MNMVQHIFTYLIYDPWGLVGLHAERRQGFFI